MTLILPRVILAAALVAAVFAQPASAQEPPQSKPAYSESIPYEPPLFSAKPDKKSKDKKDKNADAPGPAVTEDAPITVPVSVFDAGGQFVSGLKRDDFKVFTDGSDTQVLSVKQRDEPLNVLLVVDTGPSDAESFKSVKQLAAKLIGEFPASDKISVLEWGGKLKELAPLTTDRAVSIKAVSKLKMGDGTSLYDVSQAIFGEFVPTLTGRTVLILLTDGLDTTSSGAKYSEALVAAEKSGISIYPVYLNTLRFSEPMRSGDGLRVVQQQALERAMAGLRQPSSPQTSGDDYVLGKLYINHLAYLSGGRASDATSLLTDRFAVVGTLPQELHQQYYVTFSPVGPSNVGQRKHLKVRVQRPQLIVLARGSYIVGSPPPMLEAK